MRSCNTVLGNLASMLIPGYVREILHYSVVDYGPAFICSEEYKALSDDMIATYITTKVKNSTIFESFVQKKRHSVRVLLILDQLVL